MLYRPTDHDLTFYLQVYKDVREARWCLSNLRKHYPAARVLLVSDGDDQPAWPRFAKRFEARYVPGQRLYGTENGGRMVQRMFDFYLEEPTPYLIKIDTDTWTHRRLKTLPTGCRVFGTLEWITWAKGQPLGFPNVQGGFVGFTREAVQRITHSGLLISDRLVDYANTYADTDEIRRRAENGLISFDFVTRYACRVLGVPCDEYSEVKSKYRGWVRETQGQYAFTHPHKEIARRSPLASTLRQYVPEPARQQLRATHHWTRDLIATMRGEARPAERRGRLSNVAPPVTESDAA